MTASPVAQGRDPDRRDREPRRPADVGVLGDRILAVGDLSTVAARRSRRCRHHGRVVAPVSSIRTDTRTALCPRRSAGQPSPRATRPAVRQLRRPRWRRSPRSGARPSRCSCVRTTSSPGGVRGVPRSAWRSTARPNVPSCSAMEVRASVLGRTRGRRPRRTGGDDRSRRGGAGCGAIGLLIGAHLAPGSRRSRRDEALVSRRPGAAACTRPHAQ